MRVVGWASVIAFQGRRAACGFGVGAAYSASGSGARTQGFADSVGGVSDQPQISTLGELRASGHTYRSLRDELRESSAINQASGVSARFAIAGAETVAAAARHRATVRDGEDAVARFVDIETTLEVLRGKVEFEAGEEGREQEILEHLLRIATIETVREHYRGLDFGPLVEAFDGHRTISTGDRVTAAEFLEDLPDLGESTLYDEIAERLDATNDGARASAIELALEGLFLSRRLSKERDSGETVYG